MAEYYLRKIAPGLNSGADWYNAFTGWSDLTTAISTASGDVSVYCDDSSYSGNFSSYVGNIDFYGGYVIPSNIGDGMTDTNFPRFFTTLTSNTATSISGVHSIDRFFTTYSGTLFNVPSGTALLVSDSDLRCENGIVLDGSILLNNVRAVGYNNGTFLTINTAVTSSNINGLNIGGFNTGILATAQLSNINSSVIHDCGTGIYLSYDNGEFSLANSLVYNSDVGVQSLESGNLITISRSTIIGDTAIDLGGSSGNFYYSIVSGSIDGVSNFTTGEVSYCDIIPSNATIDTISEFSFSADPLFNDSSHGDVRLKVGSNIFNSSPCLNAGFDTTPDNFEIISDINGFKLFSNDASIYGDAVNLTSFMFQTGDTFVFSDYGREILLANMLSIYYDIKYVFNYRKQLVFNNLTLLPSFSVSLSGVDEWPWDWDWKEINTPEITTENKYIVPRSILDVGTLIKQNTIYGVDALSNIVLSQAKVWKTVDYGGISFDPLNSVLGSTIVWVLDTNNQTLIRRDLYTGDVTDSYPLLCPNTIDSNNKAFVSPSGLIPITFLDNGKFRFIRESEPSLQIDGDTEVGTIKWLPTDINPLWDIRGLLSYKDSLYITAVNGTTLSGVPFLLRYSNRDYYKNYITADPTKYELDLSNSNPQDLTIYEDGTLMIIDGSNSNSQNNIYKYKFRYDYALAGTSYNNKVQYILRENYDDVSTNKHI